jgi:hypothetical protein
MKGINRFSLQQDGGRCAWHAASIAPFADRRRRLKLDRPNQSVPTNPYVHVPLNSGVCAAQVARAPATQIKHTQLA